MSGARVDQSRRAQRNPAAATRRVPRDVPAAVHGSIDLQELQRLGLRPAEVIDFSANINPYAPSPAVRAALTTVPLGQYPDRACGALIGALAESLNVAPERILAGNGASELIWLTALAFLHADDRVLVLGPTYSEYARAAALLGARVSTWQAREETRFSLVPREIVNSLDSLGPRVVFLCNPNNPTGSVLPIDAIAGWARRYAETLFVVDEAYLPFAPGLGSAVAIDKENILVLRSMTKDYGLAGVRLGYAIGAAEVIAALHQAQPPWSVNALAQAAGIAALRDGRHVRDALERLGHARAELVDAFARLGLMTVPSAAHFFLVRVGNGAAFRLQLLRRGVVVRDAGSFGLAAYVRIATRRPEENERLLAAVRKVIA